MKKIYALIFSLLAFLNGSNAQTFVQVGTGTDTSNTAASAYAPVYRASSNSGTRSNRSNTLFLATELASMPAGATIVGLAWEKSNAGGTNPNNPLYLGIWMRNSNEQPPLAITTLWTDILATHTPVYSNTNAIIPQLPGWVYFALNQPFTFTGGGLEIATENQIGGASPYGSDRFNWVFTAGSGDFAIGGNGSTTFINTLNNTNTTAKNRTNTRIFYTVPVTRDMRVDAVLSPVPPVNAGSVQQVQFEAFNAGLDTISTANIHYRLNGGNVVTESWTGSLFPTTAQAITFATPLQLPLNFTTQQLEVWISNVNGLGADNVPGNDSIVQSFCLAIPAGSYQIGGASADFSTLDAAVTALNCGGVSGAVQLLLAPGVYTGNFAFGLIPGASSLNTVSFSSATFDAADVLMYNDSAALSPEIIQLNGSVGIQFSYLTFVNRFSPTGPNHLVNFRMAAHDIRIANCVFLDSVGTLSANNRALGLQTAYRVVVESNSFRGFGHGIHALGQGYELENQILYNQFTDYLLGALYMQTQQGAVVKGNVFSNYIGSSTSGAALELRSQRNITVEGNRVLGAIPRYAFYLYDFDNHAAGPNRIINNEVAGFTTSSVTSATAIRQCYVIWGFQSGVVSPPNPRDQFEFVNNTAYLGVNTGSSNIAQALLHVSGGADTAPSIDSLLLLNNNFVAYPSVPGGIPGAFRAMSFNVQAPINSTWSNHNNFALLESTNPLIRRNSPAVEYTTVAAWSAANQGRDSASYNINPLFIAPSQAKPTADTLNNKGTVVSYVNTDILGLPRDANTPDIGAYEFVTSPIELSVFGLLSPVSDCGISDTSRVRFQVANLGNQPLVNYILQLSINGQIRETRAFGDTLFPASTLNLAFDSLYDFSIGGGYEIAIYPLQVYDPNPLNDTLRQVVYNELINAFPFVENLDGYPNGNPAFVNGWQASGGSYQWFVNNASTSTNATGPAFDATTGSNSGRYLYTEASNGVAGQEAIITTSCLDLSTLSNPMLEFWYHGHGADCFLLITEQEIAGVWAAIDTLEGPTHSFSREAWFRNRVKVDTLATKLRFRAIRGASFEGDWAIDDIRIAEFPANDVRISGMDVLTNGCDSTGIAAVVLSIRNEGSNSLSVVPVGVEVNGLASTYTLTRALAAGASDTLQLQLALPQAGANSLTAYTSLVGDADGRLDTLRKTAFLSGTIRQFPYVDNFEAASLWHTGGINSSWQRATPAATVLNSSFNGSNSWVTNATGLVNSEEQSWLESPCFDFSGLVVPQLSFAIWYNSPITAGANLQYSTDGGNSWQVLGGLFSGLQWYTRDSVGVSAGQPVWSGVINPSGWRVAQQPLGFLAGQASVKFRFQMFSPATNLLAEGIAIDSFRIADAPGSLPIGVTLDPPAQCIPVAHMVRATDITNYGSILTAEVRYRVNGGAEQATNFLFSAGNYLAQIPRQAAGDEVSWYIFTNNASGVYEGPVNSYRDGFVQPQIANISGTPGNSLVLDALTAKDTVLEIGLVANQPAAGARMRLEALRHLEIAQMELRLNTRTSIEVYYATTSTPNTYDARKATLVGSIADARPDSSGRYLLQLQNKIRMQAGDVGMLYVKGFDTTSLLIENMPLNPVVGDSNLVVSNGLLVNMPFVLGNRPAQPAIRFFVESPVDSIRWFNSLSGNIALGTSRFLPVLVPTIPIDFYLEFETDGCVRRDTFSLAPTDTRDVSVDTILTPSSWPELSSQVVTKVVLRNLDVNPTGSLNLTLFADGFQLATGLSTRSIPAGDTIHFSFPPATIAPISPGVNICVTVAPDTDPSNDTACLFIADPTSVHEGRLQQVQLYPNPAQTQSILRWTSNSNEVVVVQLRDALGRALQTAHLAAHEQLWVMDLSHLAAGMYYVCMAHDGQWITKKLLITR